MSGIVTRVVDKETRARVDALILQNMSLRAIGREADVSHEYVRGRREGLRKGGVQVPDRPAPVFVTRETPVADVRRLAAQEWSGDDIAAALSVTVRTVYRIGKKYGISIRRTKIVKVVTDLDVAAMVKMYCRDDLSLEDIAERFGISPMRVRRLLLKQDVTLRPPFRPKET